MFDWCDIVNSVFPDLSLYKRCVTVRFVPEINFPGKRSLEKRLWDFSLDTIPYNMALFSEVFREAYYYYPFANTV
jgi:hypothetical protein